jgi:transcriptional regulator with XRE-family HTH domain
MTSTPAEQVAANLRAEIARQRISQRDLANYLGLSQQSVSARLLGRIPLDVNELVRVAEFLNVPLGTLLPVDLAVSA